MNSRKLSWKNLCVSMLLLLGLAMAPAVQAEELSGEVTGVDLVKHLIHMDGDVVLEVSEGSRLFDREGKRIDLIKLSKMVVKPDEFGGRPTELIPYAVYTVVDASGRQVVEELHLQEVGR